jgi:hypothetical protein
MDIKSKFLSLTSRTYPYGSEYLLEKLLPSGFKRDEHGNYFLEIGESKTMFTCHLDTACKNSTKVSHVVENNFIKSDETTILGADDKAGMCVILYLIENKIPGTYYFFVGEEVGCVGSRKSSIDEKFKKFDRCISFDRRGYNSVITHQMWGKCCSDEFSKSLCEELNKSGLKYQPDDTGIVTDSASFMGVIPECTNISVGYFNEHTTKEKQDIKFLIKLCESAKNVNWESLPVCEFDMYEDYEHKETKSEVSKSSDWLSDKMEVHVGSDVYLARLKTDRILKERSWIYEWVFATGSYHNLKSVDWDGKICYINYQDCRELLGERQDLIYVIDELIEIPLSDLVLLEKL